MPDKQVIIGRSDECEIPVQDEYCSSLHCSLVKHGKSLIIKDLDSKNGTYLNGSKIDQENLYTGDLLSFGTIKISIDEVHTSPKVLTLLAPPQPRRESIPYYESTELTKTHIKLRNFKLNEDTDSNSLDSKRNTVNSFKKSSESLNESQDQKESLLKTIVKKIKY